MKRKIWLPLVALLIIVWMGMLYFAFSDMNKTKAQTEQIISKP